MRFVDLNKTAGYCEKKKKKGRRGLVEEKESRNKENGWIIRAP